MSVGDFSSCIPEEPLLAWVTAPSLFLELGHNGHNVQAALLKKPLPAVTSCFGDPTGAL